jgi:drug/metabolite transporter (DMT)-like permease
LRGFLYLEHFQLSDLAEKMAEARQSVGIGISFALVTAIMWGIVPIAMKQVLTDMQPNTLVWYRFSISAVGLGIILGLRHQLPNLRVFRRKRWIGILLIALIGLSSNFILFSSALRYLTPTVSQVIGQLSPVGLMFASVLVLKENMRPTQIIGAVILVIGLLLFFNSNLIEIFTKMSDFTKGIIMGVCASLIWVFYAVAQKVLLRRLGSQQILLMLYVLCSIVVLPFATLSEIYNLSSWQLGCLLFCGLNTVIAYGALAEAMARWQAAQVSAIVTLTPLFTLLFSDVLAIFWPHMFTFQTLNLIAYFGAFMVVAGAMFSAIGHRLLPKRKEKNLVDTMSAK